MGDESDICLRELNELVVSLQACVGDARIVEMNYAQQMLDRQHTAVQIEKHAECFERKHSKVDSRSPTFALVNILVKDLPTIQVLNLTKGFPCEEFNDFRREIDLVEAKLREFKKIYELEIAQYMGVRSVYMLQCNSYQKALSLVKRQHQPPPVPVPVPVPVVEVEEKEEVKQSVESESQDQDQHQGQVEAENNIGPFLSQVLLSNPKSFTLALSSATSAASGWLLGSDTTVVSEEELDVEEENTLVKHALFKEKHHSMMEFVSGHCRIIRDNLSCMAKATRNLSKNVIISQLAAVALESQELHNILEEIHHQEENEPERVNTPSPASDTESPMTDTELQEDVQLSLPFLNCVL